MIRSATIHFLRSLKENNNKEWFHDHQEAYQAARNDFLELTQTLIDGVSEFDKGVRNSFLLPRKSIMRINRDIRFTKDKTPYNPRFFTFISPGGRKSPYGGYYLRVMPGESYAGGGIYSPPNPILNRVRAAIDASLSEWQALVESRELLDTYEEGVQPSGMLKRPPRGYTQDNPAIEYLKYKGFFTRRFFPDDQVTDESFTDEVLTAWKTVHPLVDFINSAIRENNGQG